MSAEGGDGGDRILALFARASELSGAEREGWLAELERADPEAARALKPLLEADALESSPLDQPLPGGLVAEALARGRTADDLPPRVGPYVVLRRLGRGGMGDVYLARQEVPIRREVALKVVRLGLSSREVLERFEQERQVLARLDHPHIARILDAGADEQGRPYFAMELVEGEPLSAHCAAKKLGLGRRLALFLQLCEAVDHAHRNGVLHRDLKPTNVLVTASGIKVIDFGVAKLLGPAQAESLATASGQFLGTPAYMSPEQARAAADVDTRSDVYTLGVLLYELLTGERPCAHEFERATSLAGLLRVVRESEPARPSARRPKLPADLDWITLKALEKERERRYRSAAEMAADLVRFLDHDPVQARPASLGYRLRKLARRHFAIFSAAGAVLVALLGLLVLTSFAYLRASRAERSYHAGNDQLRRLSDLQLLREAERVAGTLWPLEQARLADLRSWQVKYAEPLNERRGQHAERLRELREEALPYTEGDRAQDRREHPLALELEGARALVAHHSLPEVRAQGNSEYWLRTFTLKVDQLQLEVSARSTWRFSSLRDQWEHDQLARLQAELTRFFDSDPYLGAAASVARRIDEIQRMRSAEDEAAASGDWDAARAEIRRSPRYGGLELAPQQGLVPLGVDPDSGLYEFWHVASGARPVPSADPAPTSPWMLEEDTGLILVLIPGGTYRLGAQASNPTGAHFDPLAREDEVVQEVELWPYFLSKHEFTLAQWQRATGRLPAASYGPCWPACDVTWDECVELLARLGLQLPSEAQWEAAARGGTETPWWCGSTSASLAGCANIAERTTQAYYGRLPWIYESELEDPWYKLAPVDAVRANSFGLLHVAGNVLEWCADVYAPAGWTTRQGDGLRLAPPESRRAERVARGGAWQRPARSARSAERERFTSETKLPYLGLRPARPLDEHRVMLEHLSGAR